MDRELRDDLTSRLATRLHGGGSFRLRGLEVRPCGEQWRLQCFDECHCSHSTPQKAAGAFLSRLMDDGLDTLEILGLAIAWGPGQVSPAPPVEYTTEYMEQMGREAGQGRSPHGVACFLREASACLDVKLFSDATEAFSEAGGDSNAMIRAATKLVNTDENVRDVISALKEITSLPREQWPGWFRDRVERREKA